MDPLVDDITRSVMLEEIRNMPVMDFYRYIGCDVLQFGNYALPESLQVKESYLLVTPGVITEETMLPDNPRQKIRKACWDNLIAVSKNDHPKKYPVESVQEMWILKN